MTKPLLPSPSQAEVEAMIMWWNEAVPDWDLERALPHWLDVRANSGKGYRWTHGDKTYSAWHDAVNALPTDRAATISEGARGTQPEVVSWEECPACGDRNRNDAQFCSNCGTKLNRNPDNVVLAALIRRVTELEKVNAADAHFHEWSWASLDEGDRWRVWWGVFWRGMVVSSGVAILVLIIQAG